MAAKKKKSRLRRGALIGLGTLALSVPATWIAIHQVPGFGPWLVDGVRGVIGPGPIAWAEDVAYGIQDRVDRWRYRDAKPKALWDDPAASPSGASAGEPAAATPLENPDGGAGDAGAPGAGGDPFPPAALPPPYDGVASAGDGKWIAMKDPGMYKTVVHPDPKQSFAAVAVVAIDLRRIDLHMVAGTSEPQSDLIPKERRPGLVPKEAAAGLLAAFNGGFKSIHGHYGMMLDHDTFIAPRDIACTVAMYKDGSIKIRTWTSVKETEASMTGYRQTPPCLVENGKVGDAVDAIEYSRNWGASVAGETVIRRSAIGLDAGGHTLFYGLGEAVTAQTLARAMKAIGADGAAQLDVNYSYPRFLLYERPSPNEGPKATQAIIKDLKFSRHEYVDEPSPRDFFYLTRRPAS